MSFEQLKGALADLAKAQPLDDADASAKVAAAAEDGKQASGEAANGEKGAADTAGAAGGTEGADEVEGKGGNPEDLEDEGGGEAAAPMVKSFTLQLESGEEIEAVDASEMLKSFSERLGSVEAGAKSVETEVTEIISGAIGIIKAQGETIAALQKSLNEHGALYAGQSTLVAEQADLIKALRDDIDAVRNSGGGRRSAANPAQVSAESPLAKSLQNDAGEGMPPQEFLAKCLHLQKGGVLSLQECVLAEAAIGSNAPVPQAIVSKVFSHK